VTRLTGEVWARLATDLPTRDELTARLAVPDVTERLLAGIDAEGRRHLLVQLQPGDADLRDVQSRGLWVTTSDLLVSGRDRGRYLDLVCNDGSGYDALDVIGGELGERLASGKDNPADSVAKVLAKWRRFWGQPPGEALSRDAQLGLFAEVWFLTFWLVPKVTLLEAVARWRGPSGARHDFEWPGRSIEVKATTSTRGVIHRIHGIDQLAPPESGDLLLFSLQLREEAGATHSLPGLIGECRSRLEADDAAIMKFETGLAQAGYSPAHDDGYARLRVRLVAEALYRVEGDFPRLTAIQLSRGLPSGIEHVDYEINLGGFKHHLEATDPGAVTL
jgi:putative PD-(D/E)XK family protein DUF4420